LRAKINFEKEALCGCPASNPDQGNLDTQGMLLVPHGDASALSRETNNIFGVDEVACGHAKMENSSGITRFDLSKESVER